MPIRQRSVDTAWHRIIQKANLPKIRIHDGRHTNAARLRQAGVPLEDIKDMLGHKNVKTTEIYAHVSPEVKERAVNKLELYQMQHKNQVTKTLPDFYKCITKCITKNISKQTSLYHHKAKINLEYYSIGVHLSLLLILQILVYLIKRTCCVCKLQHLVGQMD